MKKTILATGVSVMTIGVALAQTPVSAPAPMPPSPVAEEQALPTSPVTDGMMPVTNAMPVPVAVPTATVPQPLVPIDQTTAAPVAPALPVAPVATAPVEAVVEEKDPVPDDVRQSVENDFKNVLPFPLTHEKMKDYARAAYRVEKVNRRWDVQIASAETDQAAIENNNFAAEDIAAALKNIKGLTMEEYAALTALTAKDTNFARLVNIYKDLLVHGELKVVKPKEETAAAQTATASPSAPIGSVPAAPAAPAAPVAAPATAERMDAIQTQIQNLSDAVKAKPAAAPAAMDPVLAAQLEAMNATLDKIANKVQSLDERTKKKVD